MHAKTLTHQLGLCSYVLERNLSELSEQESHVAPETGGSCINWVLGHITRTRLTLLRALGRELPFPMEEFDAYDDRGGVPFTREAAIPFDELKRRYKALQEPLVRALDALPEDIMDQPARPVYCAESRGKKERSGPRLLQRLRDSNRITKRATLGGWPYRLGLMLVGLGRPRGRPYLYHRSSGPAAIRPPSR